MFSTNNNHPLITRPTELILEPHFMTFHSNDRDIQKYPSSSEWSIKLPQNLSKVYTMNLLDAFTPTLSLYVFKNDYQNLAFMVHKIGTNNTSEYSTQKQPTCVNEKICTPRLNMQRPLEPHITSKTVNKVANGKIMTQRYQIWNNNNDADCYVNNCEFYKRDEPLPGTAICSTSKKCEDDKCKGCDLYSDEFTTPSESTDDNNDNDNDNDNCPSPPEQCNSKDWTTMPRSRTPQETALLRVGTTNPPYVSTPKPSVSSYNYDGCNAYENPSSSFDGTFMIKIPEGFFSGEQLAKILKIQLENTVGGTWKVHFSINNCKFYFFNNSSSKYYFDFASKINYQCCNFANKNQPDVFNNPYFWGLGFYLGFEKKMYELTGEFQMSDLYKPSSDKECLEALRPPTMEQNADLTGYIFSNNNVPIADTHDTWNGIVSCNCAQIEGESVIYMEVDKFNNVDEIFPNNTNSNATYNNTYNGIVKSAFAKLEVGPGAQPFGYFKTQVHYVTHFKNQFEERLDKLKFKFRFHDGRYVYFGDNKDINFSIQFNCAVENPMSNLKITYPPGWSS